MNTAKKLYVLLILVIIGFVSLVFLNTYFNSLIEKLDKKTKNHQNKLLIGTFISDDINIINAQFFQLAVSGQNKKSRENISRKIKITSLKILEALNVLENGGVLKRIVDLNIAGHNSIEKYISYEKEKNTIALEAIDLLPKVLHIDNMMKDLNNILELRTEYKKTKKTKEYISVIKKIKRYYKTAPVYFIRMSENINRLLYEGDIKLKNIEKEIMQKKNEYFQTKMIFIFCIIFIVLALGLWVINIVNKDNQKLIDLNIKLEIEEQSVKAILNGQKNIVIVSNGIHMIEANESIVEFFDEFNTLDDFKNNYSCICDFFKTNIPNDTYVVKKEYDGLNWLQYILSKPEKKFKVIMNNGRDDYHFSIDANKKFIKNDEFIVIVSLNDITPEIISKNKLAQLNNNLENIIDDKTEELQLLNNDLENKIKEELEKNRVKDKKMIQQSRSAALGEMIGNIAHQWRQPLSAISSRVSGMQLHIQLDLASKDEIYKSYEDVKAYVTFLTQTIDDFRGFFKEDKEKVEFNMVDVIAKSLSVCISGYKSSGIEVVEDFDKLKLISFGFPNELSQVFLNILNNAKDVTLEQLEIEHKSVYIGCEEDIHNNIIYIQDNANGIPESIKDKIFDPYFTTKHQSQGTGIGLYMSKDIVEKNMQGKILVQNREIILDGKKYNGACFKISIPKKIS